MLRRSTPRVAWLLFLLSALAVPAAAQNRALRVDYTVEVANPENNLFHVTANIDNVDQPRLELSLPVWTPGWYTIENYAKNVLRFKVTDEKGEVLSHSMPRKQTWSVDTQGHHHIRAEFDYRATVLALNQAKITKDYAFFTGTELFLQVEGRRNSPSTVHFVLPAGWKIISALKETADPATFTAPDYDALVDSPTEMGSFDITKFEVEGKPHYLVTNPAGQLSAESAQKVTGILAQVATAESAIFGGLPYEKYVYFYFLSPPESNAAGALEHQNSFVSFMTPRAAAPDFPVENWSGTAAHEFFHLWNVKRIRPSEMWPYDYSRENETPSLWVSEGITDYYGSLAVYRAGIRDRKWFLDGVGNVIGAIENNEARRYISPTESSASTWIGYDSPVAFSISYYTQGRNLGALLDLSIRHDSKDAAGLDDVMRALYRNFYEHGKGFSTEDLLGIINRLTRRDYHDFFRRYVWGVEVPDYAAILGYAGYRVDKKNVKRPVVGLGARPGNGGAATVRFVQPGSPADAAGLKVGDEILKVDDAPAADFRWFEEENAGKTLKLAVKRGADEKQMTIAIGARDEVEYDVVEVAQPAPEQLKVREGWLKTGR